MKPGVAVESVRQQKGVFGCEYVLGNFFFSRFG
jgi:hypothetical protein